MTSARSTRFKTGPGFGMRACQRSQVSATAVNPSPDDLPDLQALDASRLDAAWCPPLMFILNLARHFPTGLRRVGRRIDLALEKPDNYEDYFVHG